MATSQVSMQSRGHANSVGEKLGGFVAVLVGAGVKGAMVGWTVGNFFVGPFVGVDVVAFVGSFEGSKVGSKKK